MNSAVQHAPESREPALTDSQRKAIHALRRKAGLRDEAYRDLLDAVAGVRTSSELDRSGADRVLRHLRELTGDGGQRPRHQAVSGPYAGVLRALWMSAHALCLVNNRDDRALLAFVERQTGLAHTRFLNDPADAMKAIEALKAMCARAGVVWPQTRDTPELSKRAVIAALDDRLAAFGENPPPVGEVTADKVLAWLDGIIAARGKRLREAMARKAAG